MTNLLATVASLAHLWAAAFAVLAVVAWVERGAA